jgi:hypothetical protein
MLEELVVFDATVELAEVEEVAEDALVLFELLAVEPDGGGGGGETIGVDEDPVEEFDACEPPMPPNALCRSAITFDAAL